MAAGPRRKAPLTASVDAYLRTALRDAVTAGSVRRQFAGLQGWPVAGKTGTGEVAGKRDTSWFVSYAPANDAGVGRVGRRGPGRAGGAHRGTGGQGGARDPPWARVRRARGGG